MLQYGMAVDIYTVNPVSIQDTISVRNFGRYTLLLFMNKAKS
jgi:RNA-binding protein YlmH